MSILEKHLENLIILLQQMNEKQLIEKCSQMDQKAQRAFYDTYYRDVFRLARRYLSDFHETEDIVIIVFNKALKNIAHFEYRGEGSLKKWLNTITINESIKALKKIRPISYLEELPESLPEPITNVPIDMEIVEKILATMPLGYRTVFNLYAIDEYSHSEIAEILNISRNTSKSQMLKARKYIINQLNQRKSYGTG